MGSVVRWLALAMAIVIAGGAYLYYAFERPGPLTEHRVVVVPKGTGVSAIARRLAKNGILASPLVFRVGVVATGNQSRLEAGEYDFPPHISAGGAMRLLMAGTNVVHQLTVPEGDTSSQAASLIRAAYGLTGKLAEPPPEGSLFPDTYNYSYGDLRSALVDRMQRAMKEELALLWKNRDPDIPLKSPAEAVILASIVERETALPEERPMIAGVFYNRLRRDMPLQSDPTVAYAVARRDDVPGTTLDRPLTRADLRLDDPYNTYVHTGLPPGPISNPGAAALKAVLHPAKTDALFFVANGKGGHAFAATLEEHNRNVRAWRRVERESGTR